MKNINIIALKRNTSNVIIMVLVCAACGKDKVDGPKVGEEVIIDHTCIDLSAIPSEWIAAAKSDLPIADGHTSLGSQVTEGMSGLMRYSDCPPTEPIPIMKYLATSNPIAEVTFSEGKVKVTALGGRTLDATYVYIGTLIDLQTKNLEGNGCPSYNNWLSNTVDGPIQELMP